MQMDFHMNLHDLDEPRQFADIYKYIASICTHEKIEKHTRVDMVMYHTQAAMTRFLNKQFIMGSWTHAPLGPLFRNRKKGVQTEGDLPFIVTEICKAVYAALEKYSLDQLLLYSRDQDGAWAHTKQNRVISNRTLGLYYSVNAVETECLCAIRQLLLPLLWEVAVEEGEY